jgi:hypothetical protein
VDEIAVERGSEDVTPQRWSRIRELFGTALETPESERPQFLEAACAGDIDLRVEVERLLAGNQEPSWQSPVATLFPAAVEFAPGDTVAHYRIVDKLGAGGMGEVFRARDTKLDRDVAIKVLPSAVAQDPERLARFTREAKVLASLSHPHIAAIYGLEEAAGKRYLVLELVEGETLAQRIAKGPISVDEALEISRQIAEGLEAAHEKGIIHRDLKPANVKITPEGSVKVLDFGLATTFREEISTDPSHSPTITHQMTRPGVILGTAAYMSPEQASGKPADKRADIWSFGVLLWELLTGHRLFEGETVSHTLAEVLHGPINLEKLPPETPTAIRGLLRRCLDRNVKTRLRDMGEARITIDSVLSGESALLETAPVPSRGLWLWLAWGVAVILAVGLGVIAFLPLRERPPAPGAPVRVQIPAPESAEPGALLSLSPDGHKVAFITTGRLWVYSLESGESRDLTAAGGTPFWSKDGHFIGYPVGRKLMKISSTGGAPQTVADLPGRWGGGTWNQEDIIIFSDRISGLFRVPASGGIPVQITAVDPVHQETFHVFPFFLPEGRHFLYTRRSSDLSRSAIYIGSLDAKPEQQNAEPLVASNWHPAYARSTDPRFGYLLFVREGTLMAQPFDSGRLQLLGKPSPIADQIYDGRAFSVSASDVLVYQRTTPPDRQLTWYDRAGKLLGTVGDHGDYQSMALSPDKTRVVVSNRSG